MLPKIHGETQKEKVLSEIKFLEGKFVKFFNEMNHIETSNYHIVTEELSKETLEKSKSDSGSSQEGAEKETSGQSSGGGQESSGGSEGESSGETSEDTKKFELKFNGILTNTNEIDWDNVTSEIENLYTSIPSITMDLYQMNINQGEVLGFNSEYDNLTSKIKDKNKEETLAELVKVYEYLPKFLRGSEQEEVYTTLVETKLNILRAYAKLDTQKWEEMGNDLKNAIDTYAKLLSNTNIDTRKQHTVSKAYIMLNELQNPIIQKDDKIFLIKYKNLIEEIDKI